MRNLLMALVVSAMAAVLGLWGEGNSAFISRSSAAESANAPQSNEARSIKITAALHDFRKGATNLDLDVKLETHTQPLDDDLTKVSELIVDGKRYVPLAWEGAPPGGHHRQGVLRFGGIAPPPAVVELRIRLAGDAAPRTFRWTLK